MMNKFRSLLLFVFALLPTLMQAETSSFQNTMESSGKIYVVVGVIGIILIGIFTYLFMIDRRLRRLENKSQEKKS